MILIAEFDWIEKRIVAELKTTFENPALIGNADWTKVEFEALTALGEELGYKVANGKQADKYYGEWLFDLIWYREASEKQNIKVRLLELGLAVESEWSYDKAELMSDFQKLLVTNAQHRLMVCTVLNDARDLVKEAIQESIEVCQNVRKGDRFLIVMINDQGRNQEALCFVKD